MNNEPVAWMDEINTFVLDKDYKQLPKSLQNGMIPLYTHKFCKHGVDDGACKECYMESTHPAELTDEEIYQTWVEAKNTALNTRGSDFVEVIFARAILRKAQEK